MFWIHLVRSWFARLLGLSPRAVAPRYARESPYALFAKTMRVAHRGGSRIVTVAGVLVMDEHRRNEIGNELAAREAEYAAELAGTDEALLDAAQEAVAHWNEWWRSPQAVSSRLDVEGTLDRKFRICFPLCANAINQVEAALMTRANYPWVAKSCTRIAFEHALTAQWVLLTTDGEDRVKAHLDYKLHKQQQRFINDIRQISSSDQEFAQTAHGLSDEQLGSLIADAPQEQGLPKLDRLCGRFAGGGVNNLLYDIYADLSAAIHPSWALIRAHLRFSSAGEMVGISSYGLGGSDPLLGRELAISVLLALYAVEVCRAGQRHAAQVRALGERLGLPVDLRASDQEPSQQPMDHSAYWNPADGET